MNFFAVNLVLAVCLVLAALGILRAIRRRMERQQDLLMSEGESIVEDFELLSRGQLNQRIATNLDNFKRLRKANRVVNIATTALVLVPVGAGAYDLITNHQRVALFITNVSNIAAPVTTVLGMIPLVLGLVYFLSERGDPQKHERRMRRFVMWTDVMVTLVTVASFGLIVVSTTTNNEGLTYVGVLGAVGALAFKGGALLLTLVLKPAIMGASGWAGGQIAKNVWEGRKKEKRAED